MTLTKMITYCSILLGDPNNRKYTSGTSGQIATALNETQLEMAAELEISNITYNDYTTITDAQAGTTPANQRYALEVDFLKTKSCEIIVNSSERYPLIYLTQHDFRYQESLGTDQTGRPEFYKVELGAVSVSNANQIPGDIWLFPTPDTNGGDNYTLRHYYFQLPDTLANGTDVSILPRYMHKTLCYGACADLAPLRGDYERASFFEAKYRKKIDDHRHFLHKKQYDSPNRIKDHAGYTNTEWR